jgi:ketosteroid isomerase-like protein
MPLARIALFGAALALVPTVSAAAPPSRPAQASGPEAAATAFVAAFNALDRARFDPLFADDVTLFFPSAPFEVRRVEGKAAVLGWFGKFFDMARARSGKLNIQPVDLMVQDYGKVALVTFHLNGGENVGRRTLVLRKDKAGWKIVHLHASSQPLKKPKDESGKAN